jgi:hypothetical protein
MTAARSVITVPLLLAIAPAFSDACPDGHWVPGPVEQCHEHFVPPRAIVGGGTIVGWEGRGCGAHQIRKLPARPSLYVSAHGPWPELHDDTGQIVPRVDVVTDMPEAPLRLDVALDSGSIMLDTRYVIDPTFVPTTRSATVTENQLVVDSDAALFRIERYDGSTYAIGNWYEWEFMGNFTMRFMIDGDDVFRVRALYPDRREEIVFERKTRPHRTVVAPPASNRNDVSDRGWLLALLALAGLASLVGLLFALRRSSPHDDVVQL